MNILKYKQKWRGLPYNKSLYILTRLDYYQGIWGLACWSLRLRLCVSNAWGTVQSLVREIRSHMLLCLAKFFKKLRCFYRLFLSLFLPPFLAPFLLFLISKEFPNKFQSSCHFIPAQLCGRVPLFAVPWTIFHQAPLSMGFSRQEYWSGLPFPPPGDPPDPGIEPISLMSPVLAGRSFYHYTVSIHLFLKKEKQTHLT